MLGINCIKLIFGHLCFSPKTRWPIRNSFKCIITHTLQHSGYLYITTFWLSVHYNILVICTLQHSGYLYITTFWLSVHYNILVIWIFDFRPKVLTNVWAAFYKNWNEYERYVAYKKRFAKISETRKSRVCLILTWLKCSSMYAIPNFVGTSIRPLFFHRFSLKINPML